MGKRLSVCIAAGLFFILVMSVQVRGEESFHYKLIPLGSSDYATADALCRPMLSKGGLLVNEDARKSILVYDTYQVIDRIDQALREIDRGVQNIRIEIEYAGTYSSESLKVSRSSPHGKNSSPVSNAKNPVLKLDDTHTGGTETNNIFIVTKDKSPASIFSGATIIDPSWLNAIRDFAHPEIIVNSQGNILDLPAVPSDFKWSNVGVSLKVIPTIKGGGLIDLEIYPELSFIDGNGKKQAVKLVQLASKFTLADGVRFYAGGILNSQNSRCEKLFGPYYFRQKNGLSALDIYISASIVGGATEKSLPASRKNYGKPEMFSH